MYLQSKAETAEKVSSWDYYPPRAARLHEAAKDSSKMTGAGVAFSGLDWAVVAAYFVVNTAICIWAAMIKEKDTSDYFLAATPRGG